MPPRALKIDGRTGGMPCTLSAAPCPGLPHSHLLGKTLRSMVCLNAQTAVRLRFTNMQAIHAIQAGIAALSCAHDGLVVK